MFVTSSYQKPFNIIFYETCLGNVIKRFFGELYNVFQKEFHKRWWKINDIEC